MRAALCALVAVTGAGCKVDLDHFMPDASPGRACKVSTTAPICLAAEAENHSDFAWLQKNMFSTNCSGNDCHGAPSASGQPPSGKLVLAEGYSYKTLLGPPLVPSEFTKDHKLVQPGAPESSYLLFMLKGVRADEGVPRFTAPPSDVGYMPQSNNTLCCQKLDVVTRWIAAGALP